MAITSWTTLKAAMLGWMQRPDDTDLGDQFPVFLQNMERRMYYGYATDEMGNPMRSDPLRIPEMQTVNTTFALTSGTVAQPTGFLELISAVNNSNSAPLSIVAERVLDGYGTQTLGDTQLIAVSGSNFRLLDAPTSITATLRFYQKLNTPTEAGVVNTILTTYPDVYLFGCLIEACEFAHYPDRLLRYLARYNSSVSGLNARKERLTASTVPVMRLRAGMTP